MLGLLLPGWDRLFCITAVLQMSAGVTQASELWRLPHSHDLREAQRPPRDVCKFPGPVFSCLLLGLSSCPLNPRSYPPSRGQRFGETSSVSSIFPGLPTRELCILTCGCPPPPCPPRCGALSKVLPSQRLSRCLSFRKMLLDKNSTAQRKSAYLHHIANFMTSLE